LGNVISPQELLKKYGVDGTRYLIASSFPYDSDSDVGWKRFTEKYNADLANGLGNLVSRVAKLAEQAKLKTQNIKPKTTIINSKFKNYHQSLEEYQFAEALAFIWEKISQADKYIDTKHPWTLKGRELEKVLQPLIKEIQEIAYLLKPFLPETAEKIEKQFQGPKIKSGPPLFPRI
jgi:methionyl-tRNA synthetase